MKAKIAQFVAMCLILMGAMLAGADGPFIPVIIAVCIGLILVGIAFILIYSTERRNRKWTVK